MSAKPRKTVTALSDRSAPLEMEVLGPVGPPSIVPRAVGEIAHINSLHERATSRAAEAKAIAEEAAHLAVMAGVLLISFKERLPHGEWGKLFADSPSRIKEANANHSESGSHFKFSSRTAEKYIAVARNIIESKRLTGKKKTALIAMAGAPLDEKSRATLDKLTDGQTLRQLYLDFGIISAPPGHKAGGDTTKGKKKAPKSKPDPDLERKDAEAAITKIMGDLSKWFEQGRHQLLHKPELKHLDALLVGSRDLLKPLL